MGRHSGQSIRNLVSAAAVVDRYADPRESQIGRLVFRQISNGFDPAIARQTLAWIILNPEDGQALYEGSRAGAVPASSGTARSPA